jgi:putative ABC transport system ATP-binding protein
VVLGNIELSVLGEAALTRIRRERVGFVFQAYNLLASLTVEQNITLPLRLAGRRVDWTWLHQVVTAVGLAGRLAGSLQEPSADAIAERMTHLEDW